jgi:putative transcriptional regulator
MEPRKIALLRLALGLTQTEFGMILGVHVMTVSKWERGISKPSEWQQEILRRFEFCGGKRESVKDMLFRQGEIDTLTYLLAKAL